MLVIMEHRASEEQIQEVIDRMIGMGFDVHRSSGAMYTTLGGIGDIGSYELEELRHMPGVREAIRITSRWKLAALASKPAGSRVRIGDMEVGGEKTVILPGSAVVREVSESSQVRVMAAHADALAVPSRAMDSPPLLRELGQVQIPVILMRGETATVDAWLSAAEIILAGGNPNVVLCESGVRTFAGAVLDMGAIAELRRTTHLPVIAAPAEVSARPEVIEALGRAALAAGAHGLFQ